MPDTRQELDDEHRARVLRLLEETTIRPGYIGQGVFLAAYTAILLKDLLWITNELLTYKQQEVHK